MPNLLHLSDVHFGPPHLWAASRFFLDFVERRRPDLVVISGDLTQRAKPRQFREAREFVDALPVPWLAVPGNHDVPMYRFWERLLIPYGAYRRHFDRELEPTFRSERLHVVGLNSAFNWTTKHGRLLPRQLCRLPRRFEGAAPGAFRVLVCHHPIVPARIFEGQPVIKRARQLVDLASKLEVHLVLSGHLHKLFAGPARDYWPSSSENLWAVHSGTSTSNRGRGEERGRATCNWIALGEGGIRVQQLEWISEKNDLETLAELEVPIESLGERT